MSKKKRREKLNQTAEHSSQQTKEQSENSRDTLLQQQPPLLAGFVKKEVVNRNITEEVKEQIPEQKSNVPDYAITSLLYELEGDASIDEIRRLFEANPATITSISCTGARTALIEASVREHVEAVAFFLEKGAVVDAVDASGNTSLHWAGRQGNVAIAKLLLDNGANVSAWTKHKSHTPLHMAAEEGKSDVIRLLVERGADINAIGQEGMIPLHVAVTWERTKATKVLLELGADIYRKNNSGSTPFDLAQKYFGYIMPAHEHSMITVIKEFLKNKSGSKTD